MSTPNKYGDKTQGVPSTSKSRGGHVPLSTHGPTDAQSASILTQVRV